MEAAIDAGYEDRNLLMDRSRTELEIHTTHYVLMKRNYAEIHLEWGEAIRARTTMAGLEAALGSGFLRMHRSCLVSAARISHTITASGEFRSRAEPDGYLPR